MTRLLYDTQTDTLLPYPRQDNEPVQGLDRARYRVLQVHQLEQPADYSDPATQSITPIEAITWDNPAPGVDGTLTRSWKVETIPPPPTPPDWIGFDIAIQNEPAIVAVVNDLGRLSQVATLSLGHALEEAEHGNLDRFVPIWREWLIATTPSAEALDRFRVLAVQHHLPPEFQAAIAAVPAGPQTPPSPAQPSP